MKTYTGIFEAHGSLVVARSQKAHADIAARLEKEGTTQLTVGAFQMRNCCGGMSVKNRNLDRMLSGIHAAAEKGVQVLAFPEMCLPGYFTPVSGSVEDATSANRELADPPPGGTHINALQQAARETDMVLAFGFSEKDF